MGSLNYSRPFEPPVRPALLPLPPGAVEPAGWLRDWCLAARDGYTGHMDEVDPEFQRAWAVDHQMTGERLNWPQGAWPYEGGGYWFDGLAKLAAVLHDDSLAAQARRRLDVVCERMGPDSILFLWWLNRQRAADRESVRIGDEWPMWACGLLGRALVGYHAATGDPRALAGLETAYSSGSELVRMGWAMSNPWPAFDTWTLTGNPTIAATLTDVFAPEGGAWGWNRYRVPPDPTPGAEVNDHVVHFLESTTPWALGYLWTGERAFLDTALAWHDLLDRVAMQPSGVPVSDEYWGPTGAFRGSETCDVAGYLWSQCALLGLSGEGRLADRAERAFFNAAPATVGRDFRSHVYFQSPNRLADGSPDYPHGPRASGNSYRATHHPLCCTAALNRSLPNYVVHMWLATQDNGLAAAHYGPCRVTALVADRVPVTLDCRTDYPFDEVIEIAVSPAQPAAFPLWFRLPGWCAAPELSVNGERVGALPDEHGFARLEREWRAGDTVRLVFPMSASVSTGYDANADGAPYATVSYGPLLFALPLAELDGPNVPDPDARWRYALEVDEPDLTVERRPLPATWDWPAAAPLTLGVNAVPIAWELDATRPRLPSAPSPATGPRERLTLIPYGCAKFRLSMFPVAAPAAAGGL